MRPTSISLSNFGPYASTGPIKLGEVTTVVGKNDSGKSSIIRALQMFLSSSGILPEQVHNPPAAESPFIEVSFTNVPPKLELERGIATSFQEEALLDGASRLTVRKTYDPKNPKKFGVSLRALDFGEEPYANLVELTEKELLARAASAGLELPRSGGGVTNRSRRRAIRERGEQNGIVRTEQMIPLPTNGDLWPIISDAFPQFDVFESETSTETQETPFQSQFRPIVREAVRGEGIREPRTRFEGAVQSAIQTEIDKVFQEFQKYTDEFTTLAAKGSFTWEKAFNVEVWGRDQQGVEQPLGRRGSGFRRIFMVAYFRYLTEARGTDGTDTIFAVEEPENSLHPGLQRDLARSFRLLAGAPNRQVLITTHSPVFVGESDVSDLVVVSRSGGISAAMTPTQADLGGLGRELGVEPSDQIGSYAACLFLEGPTDAEFLTYIVETLKSAGVIPRTFAELNIGLIPCVGDNLKHFVNKGHMARLNRRFAVIVDSDRKAPTGTIPARKLAWQASCEEDGGRFFVLRKREIENYLHADAIARDGRTPRPFDDFSDMKDLFGRNVYKVAARMSAEEILARDSYESANGSVHELVTILSEVLGMVDHRPPTQGAGPPVSAAR